MIVGIVDYGRGNLMSVVSAVRRAGHEPVVGNRPEIVEQADRIILPGVGAFGEAMNQLRGLGLVDALNMYVRDGGKPYLGICVGAQIVTKESDEFGRFEGLGWIDAEVRRLDGALQDVRIPHTGWDDVIQMKSTSLFTGIQDREVFYYNHSHAIYCTDESLVIARSDYAGGFDAVLKKGRIYATLFHPEKSQRAGLQLIENFLNVV